MTNHTLNRNVEPWTDEDFVDLTGLDIIEDDPWSYPPDDDDSAAAEYLVVGGRATTADVTGEDVDSGDELAANSATVQHQVDLGTVGTYEVDETDDPVIDSLLWDGAEFGEELESTPYDFEDDSDYLDEPEPITEYDSDLADSFFDSNGDIEVKELDLRLDALIADIRPATSDQLAQIRNILSGFNSARLWNWIRWIETKEWTGHTLLLFLEFREFWECNPDWWERWMWYRKIGPKTAKTDPSVLSRDATYSLLRHRLHCEPEEVIDPAWFDDWDYYSLWKHGFYSFASYAVFRAELSMVEDWRSFVTWNPSDGLAVEWTYTAVQFQFFGGEARYMLDHSAGKLHVREADSPHRTHRNGPPHWFATQDWYDTAEWHDNLGWVVDGMEMTHPHLSPQSMEGPIWPIGGRDA